jgi:hypothetical protein
MGDVTYIIIQGLMTLLAFILGAWVYHRGEQNRAPLPSINLNKKEPEPSVDWDHV